MPQKKHMAVEGKVRLEEDKKHDGSGKRHHEKYI